MVFAGVTINWSAAAKSRSLPATLSINLNSVGSNSNSSSNLGSINKSVFGDRVTFSVERGMVDIATNEDDNVTRKGVLHTPSSLASCAIRMLGVCNTPVQVSCAKYKVSRCGVVV